MQSQTAENTHLIAPLFIEGGTPAPVDVATYPLFWNDGGAPRFIATIRDGITEIQAAKAPAASLGARHVAPGIASVKPNEPWGVERQIDILGTQIDYAPMWATKARAAAFGATLVCKAEAVRLDRRFANRLSLVRYRYGAFAGHQSPYHGTGLTMLPIVISDLERHDFPHLFCATDAELPLVISVGRYWPDRKEIFLADLWIEPGNVLYIPPMSQQPDDGSIFLHGNRNSALACWGDIRRRSIETHSLLQLSGAPIEWYWNGKPTMHSQPMTKDVA
jgi:hypothetical protein